MHAKCLFKCYIYNYKTTITAILIGWFLHILRCFHLKVILGGFVHFALMFACFFIRTFFSKLIKGSPTSIVF